MKYRAGWYGTVNAILGAVFLPVFAALLVGCCVQIARGVDVGWSSVAGLVSLAACLVMVCALLSGVSTWRAVTLSPSELSVPGFAVRRGLYRDDVPLGDISDVALSYRSEPRNGRWQLVVTRRHGQPLACDSITSSRSRSEAEGSPAWETVQRLRVSIRAAQDPTS